MSDSIPGEAVPGSAVPGSLSLPSGGSWLDVYCLNFCPNPGMETDISGYIALYGTEYLTQSNVAWIGQYSLQVQTQGNQPGEGVATPTAQIVSATTGSASLYIYGETGALTVSAVVNGGQLLGSQPVTLNGTWQRVIVNNLAMPGGVPFSLLVTTNDTQAITFYVDAVQYEPSTPAKAYVDGDQLNCAWTGTPELSASYQEYQNPTSATGGVTVEGTISFVAVGEQFDLAPSSGMIDVSGVPHDIVPVSSPDRIVIPPAVDPGVPGLHWQIAGGGSTTAFTVTDPPGGFAAFASWETGTDPDPAMSLIGQNNAGTENGSSDYARVYGMFTPPVQALDSAGTAMWQSAKYMAAGFQIADLVQTNSSGTPNAVNFTAVQVEPVVGTGTPAPSTYVLPRSLSTVIKPTLMNLIPNPAMQSATTGWTALGSETLSRDTTNFYQGDASLQVSVPSGSSGVYIDVPGLIVGDTYTLSAYVNPMSDGIENIQLIAGNGSSSAASFGSPVYGGDSVTPGYGDGPYGGVVGAGTAMAENTWVRPVLTFTATASTTEVEITCDAVSGAAYPLVFNVDAVMLSPGAVAEAYADGNSDGWGWAADGVPGLCASFYYERQNVANQAVQDVLSQHIPLGLTAYDPSYYVLPSQ